MNKGELTRSFSRRTGMSLRQSKRAIDSLFGLEGKLIGLIPATLAQGKAIRLAGFGTFETRRRAARPGRNPRTGEPLMIQAARLPAFRAGRGRRDSSSPPAAFPSRGASGPWVGEGKHRAALAGGV